MLKGRRIRMRLNVEPQTHDRLFFHHYFMDWTVRPKCPVPYRGLLWAPKEVITFHFLSLFHKLISHHFFFRAVSSLYWRGQPWLVQKELGGWEWEREPDQRTTEIRFGLSWIFLVLTQHLMPLHVCSSRSVYFPSLSCYVVKREQTAGFHTVKPLWGPCS